MPSSNPLWFGYYPGDKPITRRPKRPPPPGPEFDTSDLGINSIIDEAVSLAEKPSELPDQLKSWVLDEWKQAFNVGTTPYRQTAVDLFEFDRGEAADVKGYYASINPIEVITDPKKAATRFIQGAFGAVNPFQKFGTFDTEFWNDLDTLAEREMWVKVLDPRSQIAKNGASPSSQLGYNTLKQTIGPVDFGGQGIYADRRDVFAPSVGASGEKVVMGGVVAPGAVGVASGGVDVYAQAAYQTANFVAGKKSPFNRNESYRDMQVSFINAAATEIKVKDTQISSALSTGSLSGFKVMADGFVMEGDLTDSVAGLSGGMKGVASLVSKNKFVATKTGAEVQKAVSDLSTSASVVQTQINNIKLHYKSGNAAMQSLGTAFEADVKELEGWLDDVQNFSKRYSGIPSTKVVGVEGLGSEIAQLSGRFTNNRYDGGVFDRYLQNVSRRHFEGENSIVKLLGELKDSSGLNPVTSDGFRSLSIVYDIQKRGYLQEAGRDLIGTISKGKFGSTYVYLGVIKDRVQMFTPAYWTRKVMERTQMFGLTYNEAMADRVFHPVFNKLPWIRENTFTEKLSVNVSGIGVINATGKFKGSADLGHFYNAYNQVKDKTLIGKGAMKTLANGNKVFEVSGWATDKENIDTFIALLNGDSTNLPAGTQFLINGGDKAWEALTKNSKLVRDALKNSGIPFDFRGDFLENNDKNKALLEALFAKLDQRKKNAATLDPFVSKVGILQVYASKVSLLQQQIFTKLRLNKLIAPFIKAKAIVAQTVARIAEKLILKLGLKAAVTALLGTATGGIGVVLMPIIEKILNAVIAKVIDKVKDMARRFISGDFIGAFDSLIDDAAASTEKVLKIGCVIPVLLVMFVMFIMGVVITSTPLGDRTKIPSSTADGSGSSGVPSPLGTEGCFFPKTCNQDATCKSFPACHGNNSYWDYQMSRGVIACTYAIPIPSMYPLGIYYTNTRGYTCYSPIFGKPYYGYAADFVNGCGGSNVYVPSFDNIKKWKVVGSFGLSTVGYGVLLENVEGGSAQYRMAVLHLNDGNWAAGTILDATKGDGLGTMASGGAGWVPHIHVELRKGTSQILKPEAIFTSASCN